MTTHTMPSSDDEQPKDEGSRPQDTETYRYLKSLNYNNIRSCWETSTVEFCARNFTLSVFNDTYNVPDSPNPSEVFVAFAIQISGKPGKWYKRKVYQVDSKGNLSTMDMPRVGKPDTSLTTSDLQSLKNLDDLYKRWASKTLKQRCPSLKKVDHIDVTTDPFSVTANKRKRKKNTFYNPAAATNTEEATARERRSNAAKMTRVSQRKKARQEQVILSKKTHRERQKAERQKAEAEAAAIVAETKNKELMSLLKEMNTELQALKRQTKVRVNDEHPATIETKDDDGTESDVVVEEHSTTFVSNEKTRKQMNKGKAYKHKKKRKQRTSSSHGHSGSRRMSAILEDSSSSDDPLATYWKDRAENENMQRAMKKSASKKAKKKIAKRLSLAGIL